jgi:hypothetical protein
MPFDARAQRTFGGVAGIAFGPTGLRDDRTQQVVPERDWQNRNPPPAGGAPREIGAAPSPCGTAIAAFVRWDGNTQRAYRALYAGNPEYRAAADRLDAECFGKPPAIDRAVARNVGAFVLDGGYFCMGLRVAPARVLTARHCFFDKSNSRRLSLEGASRAAVRFQPLDATARAVGVRAFHAVNAAQELSSNAIPHAADKLVVELESDIEDAGETLAIASPGPGERLVLYGAFSYAFDPGARSYLRVSGGDTCYIGRVDETRCIYHGCNTTPGFSGTPLIAMQDGRAKAVGIHVAGARETGRCAWGRASDGVGNVAASIDAETQTAWRSR